MTQDPNDTTSCTCSGYVKEIHYTVRVTPTEATNTITRAYFATNSVSVVVVIGSTPITGQCGSDAIVSQKYSIRFVSSDLQTQMKSGNPGYMVGKPLLLGRTDPNSGGILLYENGYQLRGAD